VLTSNVSACAEVAADAALTVDPLNVNAIAGAIVKLFRDAGLRRDLVEKGKHRSAEYTWKRTAQTTLDVIEQCLKPQS